MLREELGGHFVDLVERCSIPDVGIEGLVARYLSQGDAHLLRNPPQCLREREVFDQHHEFENITTHTATETVKDLLGGMDGERGCLLLMERAQSLQVDATFAQLDIVTDNPDDVSCGSNFVHLAHEMAYSLQSTDNSAVYTVLSKTTKNRVRKGVRRAHRVQRSGA